MERCVALFISGREGFFREKACVNCSVEEYCACDGADVLFDIDEVMKKELIDVGEGVRMTESVKVERDLLTGNYIYASLSHKGILGISANENTVQFTDLNSNRKVEMEVENISLVGFYDSVIILLTYGEPLREVRVEEVFGDLTVETFKVIEGSNDVYPNTDVSLLHKRRILYYCTMNDILFSFNVDTRENIEIDVGKRVASIASLTGIDCGLKITFQSNVYYCTHALKNDDTITKVNEKQNGWFTILFPSSSSPRNIKDAVFKYWDDLMKDGNKIDTRKLIDPDPDYSVIRVYRDIFLAYDRNTQSWYLLRILVP